MTFTYNSASVTTALGKIRLEIGDTDSTAALFTDEELQVYRDNRADNVYLAAADACDQLATRFARAYDFSTDGQSFSRGQMSKMYQERATDLRRRANSISTLTPTRIDGYSDDITNTDVGVTGTTNPRRRYYGEEDLP